VKREIAKAVVVAALVVWFAAGLLLTHTPHEIGLRPFLSEAFVVSVVAFFGAWYVWVVVRDALLARRERRFRRGLSESWPEIQRRLDAGEKVYFDSEGREQLGDEDES
jgi:uncharacterized membrane protein YccC